MLQVKDQGDQHTQVLVRATLPSLQTTAFLLRLHLVERKLSGISYKCTASTLTVSSKLNCLPITHLSTPPCYKVQASTYDFGGIQFLPYYPIPGPTKFMSSHAKYTHSILTVPKILTHSSITSKFESPRSHLNIL